MYTVLTGIICLVIALVVWAAAIKIYINDRIASSKSLFDNVVRQATCSNFHSDTFGPVIVMFVLMGVIFVGTAACCFLKVLG